MTQIAQYAMAESHRTTFYTQRRNKARRLRPFVVLGGSTSGLSFEAADMNEKKCAKCSKVKLLVDFSKNKNTKDGLQSWCKSCKGQSDAEYQRSNPERCRATVARYRKRYPGRCKVVTERWRACHSEKVKETKRRYRAAHPGASDIAIVRWQKAHPEKVAEIRRKSGRKRRAQRAAVKESFSVEDERFVREYWQNECAVCGRTQEEEMLGIGYSLAIDHWQSLSKGNPLTVLNAVLLCCSCNSKKWQHDPSKIFADDAVKRIETKLELASVFKAEQGREPPLAHSHHGVGTISPGSCLPGKGGV